MTRTAVLVAACATVMSGCGAAGAATGSAQALASTLAAQAPTPPGAHRVSGLSGAVFRGPGQEPACDPLVLRTSYWTTTASLDATVTALQRPDPRRFTVTGSGSGSGPGNEFRMVVLAPRGRQQAGTTPPSIVYVVAAVGGATGVRSDVEVVPAGAGCTRS